MHLADRHSVVRKKPYIGNGVQGPDTMYVVELYKDDRLVEERELPGKSKHYANSLSENWDEGRIDYENTTG
tara:strand:+ start:740 stop:952 length:213 start_codon:yes stop_codon:yes gene_type:complete